MTEPLIAPEEKPQLLLTKPPPSSGRGGAASTLPAALQTQAIRRLRGLSLATAILFGIGWVVPNAIAGRFLGELTRPGDWVPVTLTIFFSLVVHLLTRSRRVPEAMLIRFGLRYQVVVSYGLAFSQYWGAFAGVPANGLTFDRVGIALVGVWMIMFTVLVPTQPTRALLAVLGSATAIPVVFALGIYAGSAPALEVGQFIYILVLPYVFCAGVSFAAARAIYRLGSDLKRATELGSYRLEQILGRGGMGEVWRARHRLLARPAAIKLIRLETLAGYDHDKRLAAHRRFEREAQVTATLASHHSVQLFDFGTSQDGSFYYVMELLDGVDLETLVREHGPVPPARAVFLLRQACHSLADAHQRGLIHRDVKPANIFVCRKGLDLDFIKVLDFGLVALQAEPQADARLTADGIVAGTPAYLPPEMAEGGEVDGRADLYALGCVAFWLLTGRLVFAAETAMATVVAHAREAPTAPSTVSELSIPAALDELVLSCLEKRPEDRPPSATALAERLDALDLADTWTAEQARAWWDQHRPGGG